MAAGGTVNAIPEGDEVIDGGEQGNDQHEPDGHAGDEVNSDDESEEVPLVPAVRENGSDDGDNLQDHLQFAEVAGLNGEAFGGGNTAKSGDEEFASQDQNHDPGGHEIGREADEEDESGGDEEFVGHGVEKDSHAADLSVLAGEVTV